MTALGDHATAELDYQGIVDPERALIVTIVGTFAEFADEDIPEILEKVKLLLDFKPLSPLTNDPAEWDQRDDVVLGQQVWQSNRQPDAWTYDSGFHTYFLMSEHNGGGISDTHTTISGES
ncbi:hypothetical protein [Amycolatopsis japonica]